MKTFRITITAVAALGWVVVASPMANGHCQVPCGIYGDPGRFATLNEHIQTIEKAVAQIKELAGKTDAQSVQQVARWVANKESHATEIQVIAQEYFLAQRIKFPKEGADKKDYYNKLEKLHQIIVYAMKCKQTVDPAHVTSLNKAVAAFQEAYGH